MWPLGGGTFSTWSWGWSLTNEISALIKAPHRAPGSLCYMRHSTKVAIMDREAGSHQTQNPWPPTIVFPASRRWEINKFLLFRPLNLLYFCYSSPKGLRLWWRQCLFYVGSRAPETNAGTSLVGQSQGGLAALQCNSGLEAVGMRNQLKKKNVISYTPAQRN